MKIVEEELFSERICELPKTGVTLKMREAGFWPSRDEQKPCVV